MADARARSTNGGITKLLVTTTSTLRAFMQRRFRGERVGDKNRCTVQYQAAIGQPQRKLILARNLSYHGTTISMAGLSGHASRKRGIEPLLEDHPYIQTPYPLRCPLGPHHAGARDYYLQDLEDTIQKLGPENIAALVAEPINGSSGGAITPPQG